MAFGGGVLAFKWLRRWGLEIFSVLVTGCLSRARSKRFCTPRRKNRRIIGRLIHLSVDDASPDILWLWHPPPRRSARLLEEWQSARAARRLRTGHARPDAATTVLSHRGNSTYCLRRAGRSRRASRLASAGCARADLPCSPVLVSNVPADRALVACKAAATKALNHADSDTLRKRWSRGGSTRGLRTPAAVTAAVHYVVDSQGAPMSVYLARGPVAAYCVRG